jgi:hypothetical protein
MALDGMLAELMSASGTFRQQNVDAIRRGPISFLLSWIQNPDPDGNRALADQIPLLFSLDARELDLGATVDLTREAALLLRDPEHEPGPAPSNPEDIRAGWWWSSGTVGLLARMTGDDLARARIETVLVVDDRKDTIADAERSAAGWREWLRISNALALREQPTVITALTEADTSTAGTAEKLRSVRDIGFDLVLDPAWQAARDLTETDDERAFLDELARLSADGGPSLPSPDVGYEIGDGLPVDFAWPDARIAVFLDLTDDDPRIAELSDWRVFGDDRAAVAAQLREAA